MIPSKQLLKTNRQILAENATPSRKLNADQPIEIYDGTMSSSALDQIILGPLGHPDCMFWPRI